MTGPIGRVALVTGATSGLGFETAAQLLEQNVAVVVAGRTAERAYAASVALTERTGQTNIVTAVIDLNTPASINAAVDTLDEAGTSLDILVLNAGLIPGSSRELTSQGIDVTFAASLTGHHNLTVGLLNANLLASDARIVISGSEAARGDVPLMAITDLADLAKAEFDGDLAVAAAALITGDAPRTYKSMQTYANAKVFVAWWASALARRLVPTQTVNAVSPGATPGTAAGRHQGFFMRQLMMPMMSLLPKRLHMAAPVAAGASRYLEATRFGPEITGQFWASAPKRMHGPMERMRLAHLDNVEYQEAAWSALVATTGKVYPLAQ